MSEITEQEPFEWPVRVYYEDTDAQGVVYYANYFRFMERARTEWLRALGVNQERMLNEERRMFVVTFDIEQNIYRDSRDGVLCCRGGVSAALLHADTLRPQRIPVSIFEESYS